MHDLKVMLERAGFDEAAITATIGTAPVAEAVPLHARRLSNDPRVALVRLFVLGETVAADELPVSAEALETQGFVERDGDVVRASFRLTPFDGLLLAHDDERSADENYVTGVNNASRTLATLTVRDGIDRALDLGTGCGVQGLLAARHSKNVVAVDLNPRALHYAGLNARLNGVQLDLRHGSWFEPVADESFDLIVSNPPFVISPDTDYVFRDSGLGRDAISRQVVRGAAAHLRTGGYATVLCNWICGLDETWEPLADWVADTGCDALLLAHDPVEPFHYAARWNESLRRDAAKFSAAIERWLDYYEREHIPAIGIGAVVLRRRDGETWIRGLHVPRPATGNAGRQIVRLFAATDDPLPSDFGDERLAPVPGHRLDQTLRFHDEYELASVTMSLDDGVGVVAKVDARALPVLFALDGDSPVREALAEVNEHDGPVAEATLRELYGLGLLERKTPSPSTASP
jgi:methylase of polypeptide subunit release factors